MPTGIGDTNDPGDRVHRTSSARTARWRTAAEVHATCPGDGGVPT
jgi:hypothetical protein